MKQIFRRCCISMAIGLGAGCTIDPAHLNCERRLVPINAVASMNADRKRKATADAPVDARPEALRVNVPDAGQ